jgi:uncharacterized protein YeaO (DUF488 family)
MAVIHVKRVYRILVDRLWPRGVSKETAKLNYWLKAAAPSTELRQWFHGSGEANKWELFKARYILELKQNPALTELTGIITQSEIVTFLYSVNDPLQNHAIILKEFIEG